MQNLLKFKLLTAALILIAGMSFQLAPYATSAHAGWEFLGARKIDYRLDRDEILVTRAEGVFSAIKLKVRRSPINLHKVVIHYGNGEVDEIETRNNIRAGGETRVIDLPGNKRVIQKVVFWYDTKNLAARKGVLELWGRH